MTGFEVWVEVADRRELDDARRLGVASAYVARSGRVGTGRPDDLVLTEIVADDLDDGPARVASRGRGPLVLPATAAGFETAAVLRARRREVAAVRVDDDLQVALAAAAGIGTVVTDRAELARSVRPGPRVVLRVADVATARRAVSDGADGIQVPLAVARRLLAAPATPAAGGDAAATQTNVTSGLPRTTAELLAAAVARDPDGTALVHVRRADQLTWRDLGDQVDRLARGLLALGVEHGDRVTLWAWNRTEWPIVQLATAKIGVVLVTANPQLTADELTYLLGQSGSVALLAATDDTGMSQTLRDIGNADLPGLRHLITIGGSRPLGARRSNRWVAYRRVLQLARTVDGAALERAAAATAPDDVVNIQYTSGTTGRPKGARLTHAGMIANAEAVAANLQLSSEDRLCLPVPFHHCFGCVLGTLASLASGAALIVPADRFSPTATLEAIDREQATAVYGVPTMFTAMLAQDTDHYRLDSLRTAIAAGAPVRRRLMERIRDELHVDVPTIVYGLTEASPVVTATPYDADEAVRFETVGVPLEAYEVRAVEPETGESVPDGQPGELLVRGSMLMAGYHDDPDATAAAIDPHGWLHTGDLAVRDDQGNWRIVGRRSDLIIRGGENIYPARIEDVLAQHPDVHHVAVVGVPDEYYGEAVRAHVEPVPGAAIEPDDLVEHCRHHLAPYEIPTSFVVTDRLPTTASGKIRRHDLRDRDAVAVDHRRTTPASGRVSEPGGAPSRPGLPLLAGPAADPGRPRMEVAHPEERVAGAHGPRSGWQARSEPTWRWHPDAAPRTKPAGQGTETADVTSQPAPPTLARAWRPAMTWTASPTSIPGRWTPRPAPSRATVRRSLPAKH